MSAATDVRRALLELHRELLAEERRAAEKVHGRMSANVALQAATEDPRFRWLAALAALITDLDVAVAEDDAAQRAAALARTRALLDPPDDASAFGYRYLRSLQENPAVVLAHRDVVAALGRSTPAGGPAAS